MLRPRPESVDRARRSPQIGGVGSDQERGSAALTYTHSRRRFSTDLPSPWADGPVRSYFVPVAALFGGPSELSESEPRRPGPQASPR